MADMTRQWADVEVTIVVHVILKHRVAAIDVGRADCAEKLKRFVGLVELDGADKSLSQESIAQPFSRGAGLRRRRVCLRGSVRKLLHDIFASGFQSKHYTRSAPDWATHPAAARTWRTPAPRPDVGSIDTLTLYQNQSLRRFQRETAGHAPKSFPLPRSTQRSGGAGSQIQPPVRACMPWPRKHHFNVAADVV